MNLINKNDKDIHIQIGNVCCSIICNEAKESQNLNTLYVNFITNQPPDVSIQFTISGLSESSKDTETVTEVKIHNDDDLLSTNTQVRNISYDKIARLIQVDIEKESFDIPLESNLLNRLLIRAYYSAPRFETNNNSEPLIVHSCGILRNEKVILFIGPSGAGKTTIAHMCEERYGNVINDEMLLIDKKDDGYIVRGMPIIGEYTPQLNVSASLSCIFLLKQEKQTSINPMKRSVAYSNIMRQILPPSSIGETDDKGILSLMADFSSELTGTVPFRELEFSLDSESLWKEIQKFEKELE